MKTIWGLLAEFDTPSELLEATKRAHSAGYRKMDAYSPFPIENLGDALGRPMNLVPMACLIGGILGGGTAYILQYWINVVGFPINVGGRPLHSWPSFIPVTFEMTVLFASFGAFFGMWLMNGLPLLHHPLFNLRRFEGVTSDRFFLCIESSDPQFEIEKTRAFLLSLQPDAVEEVPYR